jgi:hypothetical protein
VSNVSAIWSNSVCGSKQPFWALASLAKFGLSGSRQVVLPGTLGSSMPSKLKPSGAGSPVPRMISRYLRPKLER